jgi:uncharacterized protein
MESRNRLTLAIAVIAILIAGGSAILLMVDRDPVAPVQAQEFTGDRGITVQGEGQVSVVPDTATVVLGVQLDGEEIDALREEANSRMDAVIAGLQADGIAEGDIRTVTYDISVRRNWEHPDAPITGYILTHLVEVKISDIDRTGEVIDNALSNGANNVGSIHFDVEDRAGVIRQAREQAMSEAREKAEHLAQLGGVNLGAPVAIRESSPALPPIYYDEPAYEVDEAADAFIQTRVEPGESIVTVYVTVVYAIT